MIGTRARSFVEVVHFDYNLTNNQRNVFQLSKCLLTCKTTLYAMRSYESASKNLYQAGHQHFAYILEQKHNDLKRWLTLNDQVL